MSQLYLRVFAIAAAAVLAATLTGCGGGGTPSAAPTVTVTAQPEPSAPAATTAAADTKAADTKAADTKAGDAGEASAAPRKRLPNVVGMNLQAAQDLLQAHGFYVLDDQDATGQKRLQVYDRNWLVVRQVPAAGGRVRTDTLITLWAKKYGE